jgi:hypothetical protein
MTNALTEESFAEIATWCTTPHDTSQLPDPSRPLTTPHDTSRPLTAPHDISRHLTSGTSQHLFLADGSAIAGAAGKAPPTNDLFASVMEAVNLTDFDDEQFTVDAFSGGSVAPVSAYQFDLERSFY